MARVNDPRIADLIDDLRIYADRLADYLSEIAVTQSPSVSIILRKQVRNILQEMREYIEKWAAVAFGSMAKEWVSQIETATQSTLLSEEEDDQFLPLVVGAVAAFRADVNTAIGSINSLVNRLSRRDTRSSLEGDHRRFSEAVRAGAAGTAVIAIVRTKLADRLRTQMVEILGTNGRIYKYDLRYYLALSAHLSKGKSQFELVMAAASKLGEDLVQVSANRSTIGDYCDLYRGKVFSISGQHPIFHAISQAPSGGTPFHPWCHHTISIFDDSQLTDASRRELAHIPEEFLKLGRDRASPNRFMNLWLARKNGLGFL